MCELPDAVAAADTVLVCDRTENERGRDGICTDLLASAGTNETVVLVTDGSPSAGVEASPLRPETEDTPALTVVAVGHASAVDPSIPGADVRTVPTPSDLTCLGVTLSQVLSANESVVLCSDSLTALLERVDDETAYEFVHALLGQLRRADASAHFHVDPTAHDRQTVDALSSLFDTVVECEAGERTVRTRKFLR